MGLIHILTPIDYYTQYLPEAQRQGEASEWNKAQVLGESQNGVRGRAKREWRGEWEKEVGWGLAWGKCKKCSLHSQI